MQSRDARARDHTRRDRASPPSNRASRLESVGRRMDPAMIDTLVARARDGDERALADLFHHYQPKLVRMVELRLDAALRRRMDPADVVQEAWLEIVRRFGEWRAQSAIPFHVWLRLTTAQ